MKRFIIAVGVAFMLVACSATQPQIPKSMLDEARAASYTLNSSYLLTLKAATAWANPGNRCRAGYPVPPPACSTAEGVLKVEAVRIDVKATLVHLDAVIADANTTPGVLDAAVSAARNGMALYNQLIGKAG